MVKISQLISDAAERLKTVADNPRAEARILLAHALSSSVNHILINPDMEVPDQKAGLFESFVSKRESAMPIAYITGEKDFFGLSFSVNEHTLIPRPETEMIVEEILDFGGNTLLDLCTGSGCIPIAAAKNSKLTALGVDISEGAVQMAEENARKHIVDGKVRFEIADVFRKDYFGKFDILSSNPPYITDRDMLTLPPDVSNFEPHRALAGGKDGLDFYRRITDIAPLNLNPDGLLIFEIGIDEGAAVASLMENNFTDIKIKKDLAGIERTVSGRLRRT